MCRWEPPGAKHNARVVTWPVLPKPAGSVRAWWTELNRTSGRKQTARATCADKGGYLAPCDVPCAPVVWSRRDVGLVPRGPVNVVHHRGHEAYSAILMVQ